MLKPEWRRIAGIQPQDDGTIGAAWLAHDRETDTVHVYDACLFRREVLAVVMEGLNARGRWIPIAWPKAAKTLSDQLLERGCNMLYEPVDDSQAMAETANLEVWERMRSHRLKAEQRLGEWREEFRTYQRQDGKVPLDTHPLMAATRHAAMNLDYGRRQSTARSNQRNYPRLAIY
jgi:hypothetical protein